ncbi:MAG: DUF1232 domain-containing protein [Proteobacteria bacterium]|jgi:uncharacterized membrane protein YkvA (DUF1232 family)|nr:DUF1232 domain-containing protein [Pseudomonadota bacterium]MCG2743031.1 DUF1232 domain-containing protein [Desulfobacteraceae bacterium]MBU3983281.1 DUF1232 domain-containing protein [Pseudomonadota bacterium]MBU4028326.1 DUF1232 domain-containing protein [Pseudomonadota bacterium]MBU4044150.1 DUF1232 domain-containing protein [Pseudomonadota bacterium]
MNDSFSGQQPNTSLWTTVASYARLLTRADTPWTVKGILLLAILYLLSPFDFVPDWILGLGLLDDLAIVSLLVGLAIRLVSRLPQAPPENKK